MDKLHGVRRLREACEGATLPIRLSRRSTIGQKPEQSQSLRAQRMQAVPRDEGWWCLETPMAHGASCLFRGRFEINHSLVCMHRTNTHRQCSWHASEENRHHCWFSIGLFIYSAPAQPLETPSAYLIMRTVCTDRCNHDEEHALLTRPDPLADSEAP